MSMEKTTEPDVLQEFDVKITETLQMRVTVEAADQLEAEQIVNDAWGRSEYILDADHFVGVEFSASPVSRELILDSERHEKGDNLFMDGDNTNQAQNNALEENLAENSYVKELFTILDDYGKDTAGLTALIGHVSEMENFVKRAEDRIADMKSQLDSIKEVQNHPVKKALQTAIKNLEQKVTEVKERLGELKSDIALGCKNAVTAFKEKGVSALANMAAFFHIKDGLKGMGTSIDKAIGFDEKAIKDINSFANEYHSAGRAIKNMARMAVGKEPIDVKKEAGKLAKAIAAPYKAEKAALTGLKKSVDKAVKNLEQLDAAQADKKAERTLEKKPSMLEKLAVNKERVEQAKLDAPIVERGKSLGVEV